jgi:hypothetical protein
MPMSRPSFLGLNPLVLQDLVPPFHELLPLRQLRQGLRRLGQRGLLPSVTNILAVVAKPELTGWLQANCVRLLWTEPVLASSNTQAKA